MPSPFPGMDPYLERPDEWEPFHAQLVAQVVRTLVPVLPAGYRAKSEVMLFIHEPSAEARRRAGKADAGVMIGVGPGDRGGDARGRGGAATLAPQVTRPTLLMRLDGGVDIERHRYVEVRAAAGDRLVAAIEVLSPANKHNRADRQVYLAKREELCRAGAHFLQIDLLRGGPRLLPEPPPPHDYGAMLLRADAAEADVWFWSVRDRLPTLPVPLLEPDGDVPLDLQAAVDVVYDAAGYGPFLYDRPPDPPLAGDDAAWAAGVVPSGGGR